MDEQLTAAISVLFPSGPNAGQKTKGLDEKLLQSFIEDQFKVIDAAQKSRKKKPRKKKEEELVLADPESDEELKAELENAVRRYKSNKKKTEPEPTVKQPKRDTDSKQNCNGGSERLNGEKTPSSGTNGNGDASTDLMELLNYFFGSPKSENSQDGQVKSYAEYEKLGAIPKRMAKNESNGPRSLDLNALKSRGKNSDAVMCKAKRASGEDVTKLTEETFSLPFFYIVPENPSPEFFLPRGSYYVVPGVPGSSAEDKIVFHPEKTNQSRKKDVWRMKPNLKENPSKMNNLGKDVIQKTDSHLNIGPLDVKINDFSNNLESNYNGYKEYEKICRNEKYVASEESSESSEIDEAAYIEPSEGEEYSSPIQLLSEATGPLDESWESDYISSNEKQRIAVQFERLVLALPESDPAELRKICKEFKGDDALEAYIQKVQFENKVLQRVLELQHIFPDADPNFLQESVEELNCDDTSISTLTNKLLESQNYPKISEDPYSVEKIRWWKKYVRMFSVKEYIREVRDPAVFTRSLGNNSHDTGLVFKYLQAKYPNTSIQVLEQSFQQHRNLTNTCESLNLSETIGPWKKSIENEDYTEEFLKEVCYIENRKEIDKYVKEMRERREIERQDAFENNCFLSCPLCSDDELVPSDVVTCPEGHIFCTACVTQYLTVKISDGVYKFSCPSEKCETFFTLSVLEDLLSETVLLNILKKQQAEEVSNAEVEGLESCPYCEFAYIPNPEDKIFKCGNPACLIETCRKCQEKNHIPLRCEEIERPVDLEARKKIEETMTAKLIRVCPKCRKKIVKLDGCNKIACSCGALFCYFCRQAVTGYGHFDRYSRGGCPLYSTNEELHDVAVVQAGIQARDTILQQNPNIRLLNDPTQQ